VRIALTSGLSRRQVADDLGGGFLTLNKWVSAHRDTDVLSAEDRDLARENERLRREVRILKEERDILKPPPVLREPIAVRFRFVEESGNRQANAAIYRVAIVRMRDDDRTKAYAARRTAEGKTRREIARCIKRYIVREVYTALCATKSTQIPA
jgi:transposase